MRASDICAILKLTGIQLGLARTKCPYVNDYACPVFKTNNQSTTYFELALA